MGLICASALVATGLAPAVASGDRDHNDELKVLVCKNVKDRHKDDDGHKGDDDRKGKKDEEFRIGVWTDRESGRAKLGDDECKKFKLDFKRNKFFLNERVDEDKWDVRFKVRGDDEKTVIKGSWLKVRFGDHQDHPRLKITVINKKVHDDKKDDDEKDDD